MKEPVPEFSRVVSVARLPLKGVEEKLEAKPTERNALAKRFGLIELPALKARLILVPGLKQIVAVKGTIEANVVQSCVVTLEPVTSTLALDVDVFFIPAELNKEDSKVPQEIELDDKSEFYSDGNIDIGEMVSQQLGISIDPYPRKADAAWTVAEFGKKAEKQRPFAKLATVVKSKKNKDKR